MKINYSPDLMGWFGLSWQEKVANSTYKKVAAIDKKTAKVLKDIFQPGGLNVRLIENMYREYVALMAKGNKPANFVNGAPDSSTVNIATKIRDTVNASDTVVLKFLESLYELSSTGTIEYSKWNPQGFKTSTALQKSFPSEVSFIEKAAKVTTATAKTGSILLIIAGIGVSLYYLNNYERLKSHGKAD